MPDKFVVARVPTGGPAPMGYTYVRTLRGVDIYQMKLPVIMPMDDLSAMFGNMGIDQAAVPQVMGVVEADDEQALANMLNGLTMGGRRRKTRKNRGKSQRK